MKPCIACAIIGPIVIAGRIYAAPELPVTDQRAGPGRTLDTPRVFPEIKSRADWQRQAKEIREQVLVSAGLWPLPDKAPLNAKIFGRLERDGYSVERVYFQTYPGFYLAGNLYRPVGQGTGPFPAILNPHGHWSHGRLEDTAVGSIAARCINFAKQGMIAFSYDMVGYNDTRFGGGTNDPGRNTHRLFGNEPVQQLWGISLMGLQLWNSIRALDFLESLPDADKSRLACTGASGGGTQTFLLGAVDDRLAVLAPCVMVSHSMQGGCYCENMPGLRVEHSNMEIAAAAAPRPQLLVAATGDWTKTTETIEGPAIGKIYGLFEAPDKLRYTTLKFDHNYNQPSREQVYGWFGKWLRGQPGFEPIHEQPYRKEPDADLLVFANEPRPVDAVTMGHFTTNLIAAAQAQWAALRPFNPPLLERYKERWLSAWHHTLQAKFVETGLLVETVGATKQPEYTLTRLNLGRVGRGDRLPAVLIMPRRDPLASIVVLAHPEGKAAYLDAQGLPRGLAKALIDRGQAVLLVDTFLTGELANAEAAKKRDFFKDFFTCYNRTDTQERVQDLVTACAFAQAHGKATRKVILCGEGRAGLWAMLAAPATDAVIADCDGFDTANDAAWLERDVFVPGIRRLGGFEGVLEINCGHPLLLHHTDGKFATAGLVEAWRKMHVPKRLRIEEKDLDADALAEWVVGLQR